MTGNKILKSDKDWLEWQANAFSSAILMPRATIGDAVVHIQAEMGINRNLGRIILESKGYSISDYQRVQGQLALLYGVNATNVDCRLRELRILRDRRTKNVSHISELLKEE